MCSMLAKTRISISPNQNMGMDMPMLATTEMSESRTVPRFFAATMPRDTPMTTAMTNAGSTMDRVTWSRCTSTSEISI